MTGQVGAQQKLPAFAVLPGSGQGAHDPGNEPQIGAGGPESQECSAPVCSNGRGAQQPPGGPGHKPTSEEKKAEVEVRHGPVITPSLHPPNNLILEELLPFPIVHVY